MSQGAFHVWPASALGAPLKLQLVGDRPASAPDPFDPAASNIYFGIASNAPQPIPKAQSDIKDGVEGVLRAIQQLYLAANASSEDHQKFRAYYVRLFSLAQLGCEGANAQPEIAAAALSMVTGDLIGDEAGKVKSKHLKRLGSVAAALSVPFLILYVLLRAAGRGLLFANAFDTLGVQPLVLANFMVLWVGCFLGVWLSYLIRTQNFTLADLTQSDGDALQPAVRLVFAGCITMILGIILVYPFLEISIGDIPVTHIGDAPMMAFLVGTLCGVSELALPALISKRAADFISSIK
jgi:hypothetical protein